MCSELPPGEALPSPHLGLRCPKPCPSFVSPQTSLDSPFSAEMICARAKDFLDSFLPMDDSQVLQVFPSAEAATCFQPQGNLADTSPCQHLLKCSLGRLGASSQCPGSPQKPGWVRISLPCTGMTHIVILRGWGSTGGWQMKPKGASSFVLPQCPGLGREGVPAQGFV